MSYHVSRIDEDKDEYIETSRLPIAVEFCMEFTLVGEEAQDGRRAGECSGVSMFGTLQAECEWMANAGPLVRLTNPAFRNEKLEVAYVTFTYAMTDGTGLLTETNYNNIIQTRNKTTCLTRLYRLFFDWDGIGGLWCLRFFLCRRLGVGFHLLFARVRLGLINISHSQGRSGLTDCFSR